MYNNGLTPAPNAKLLKCTAISLLLVIPFLFQVHGLITSILILVSLRFDTAGDYGYVSSKYTSNAYVLRGNHLQAHVAVRELTTQIGIVSHTHHYAAILGSYCSFYHHYKDQRGHILILHDCFISYRNVFTFAVTYSPSLYRNC